MLICYLDSLYRILKLLRKKRWCIWKYNTTWEKNDNVFESAIQLDMQCGLGCCTIRNKWDTKFDVVPQLINILYNVQHNPTHYKHCTMYNTIRYIRVSFGQCTTQWGTLEWVLEFWSFRSEFWSYSLAVHTWSLPRRPRVATRSLETE